MVKSVMASILDYIIVCISDSLIQCQSSTHKPWPTKQYNYNYWLIPIPVLNTSMVLININTLQLVLLNTSTKSDVSFDNQFGTVAPGWGT